MPLALDPLTVKKAYVDINDSQQLHYRHVTLKDSSSGVILFLHKSASSSSSWEKLMLHYADQGFSCYAPDMPGFDNTNDDPDVPLTLAPALPMLASKGIKVVANAGCIATIRRFRRFMLSRG